MINFHGRAEGMTVREAIDGALRPPWFPVPVCESPAKKTYTDLDGEPFEVDGLQVTPIWLHHPQGVTGYRIQSGDRVLVIATDHEAGDAEADARLVEAARGANLLVHDAQYTDSQYSEHEGWGHSTWRQAIETAQQAGVDHPWADAARVGMVVDL